MKSAQWKADYERGLERIAGDEQRRGVRYYADETSSHWVVSRAAVRELGRMLREGQPDAYSHWCAGWGGREVAGE